MNSCVYVRILPRSCSNNEEAEHHKDQGRLSTIDQTQQAGQRILDRLAGSGVHGVVRVAHGAIVAKPEKDVKLFLSLCHSRNSRDRFALFVFMFFRGLSDYSDVKQ